MAYQAPTVTAIWKKSRDRSRPAGIYGMPRWDLLGFIRDMTRIKSLLPLTFSKQEESGGAEGRRAQDPLNPFR